MCRGEVIHNFHRFFHKQWKNWGKAELFSGRWGLENKTKVKSGKNLGYITQKQGSGQGKMPENRGGPLGVGPRRQRRSAQGDVPGGAGVQVPAGGVARQILVVPLTANHGGVVSPRSRLRGGP